MPSIFQLAENDRSIFFFDQVHQWTAQKVIADLMRLNEEDKEKPINFFINSLGGNIIDMYAIIDVMKAIQAPIHTYTLGIAASAGSLIAACGTKGKRFISPNSQMMIHEAAMSCRVDTRGGSLDDIKAFVDKANKKFTKAYSLATGKSSDEVSKLLSANSDSFMTAEESVNFGLVDEIMTSEQISSIKLSEQFKSIKLSEPFALNEDKDEKGLKTVHLLKAGYIKKYGVEVTKETLQSLKSNFDNNVRGQEISIDYTHENDNRENPAAAWIKQLYLDANNENLFAKVEYTPKAEQLIKDKEYKYISSDIDQVWERNEDGKMFTNVLCGGTFTNRPVIKGLETMKLSENINNNKKIDMELNKAQLTSIENVQAKLNMKIEDVYDSLVAMTDKNVAIQSEKKELLKASGEMKTALEAAQKELADKEKSQVEGEKLLAVDSLIENGIILNAHKEKILAKFETKAEINDFYEGVPASLKVKATGVDLKDPEPIDDEVKEVAKQSGISEKDIVAYLEKNPKK